MPSLVEKVSSLPRAAWILFIGTFINKFGNFLSIFLVLFLTAKGYSAVVAGSALGLFGAGNFVGNLLGGTVTDRVGRRGAIVVSTFGSGICTALVPLIANNLALLLALVAVIGAFAQLSRPAAGAALLDVVSEESRTTAFAVYRLSINVGMAAGPVVGGLLSVHSYNWIFVADAVSSIVYGLIALVFLPETAPPRKARGQADLSHGGTGYRAVGKDVPFLFFLLSIVAMTYIYIQSTATLPLQVRDIGLPASFYGLLLSINAIVVVALEVPLTHLIEHRPMKALMIGGLVLLGLGFAATALAHSRQALVLTVLVWTFAEMIMMPSASAYPGRYAPASLRGRYQASFGLAQTVAAGGGPVLGSFLYGIDHALNWSVCGIVAVVGIACVLASQRGGDARTAGTPLPADATSDADQAAS